MKTKLTRREYLKQWKTKNPIRWAYLCLKHNAKRRGVPFDLTLYFFTLFCYKTEYIMGKGRSKESITIDRVDNNKGYVAGNIQPLSNSSNSAKGTRPMNKRFLHYDWESRTAIVRKRDLTITNSPFLEEAA